MVPKVAYGTDSVNMIKDFEVLLAPKGLISLNLQSCGAYISLAYNCTVQPLLALVAI